MSLTDDAKMLESIADGIDAGVAPAASGSALHLVAQKLRALDAPAPAGRAAGAGEEAAAAADAAKSPREVALEGLLAERERQG
jgi:hypothetical protein